MGKKVSQAERIAAMLDEEKVRAYIMEHTLYPAVLLGGTRTETEERIQYRCAHCRHEWEVVYRELYARNRKTVLCPKCRKRMFPGVSIPVNMDMKSYSFLLYDGFMVRNFRFLVYVDAVKRLKAAGIEVVTHIILGLPGERAEMMVQTTEAAVKAGTDGIKFHLLHVLQNTDLAKDYGAGHFACLTLEEYGCLLKKCMAVLPEHIVVHRITGDGAKKDLIAPLWSGDKKRVLNYLHRILEIK